MLIFNKDLSVCPLTTHIPISKVEKKIKKSNIINKVNNIKLEFGFENQNKHVVKIQNKVNLSKYIILHLGFLSANKHSKGPVNAIKIPHSPAVHCQ